MGGGIEFVGRKLLEGLSVSSTNITKPVSPDYATGQGAAKMPELQEEVITGKRYLPI